jgi:short-subunit dehydrogenase involved in D-alanine esterification of teichoic acids
LSLVCARIHLHIVRRQLNLKPGGGTGIGLMITLGLAQNGAKVFITSRNAEKLQDVAKKYNGPNVSGEIIP